ncbi:MAG: glucose-6-phosphate isomerase [Bryobacterales bacterium]|nr:glucose-6-phosphate isomerase [Bryobacterales bacterium]
MRIAFDERNLMADMAGKENGLNAADLRAGAGLAKRALAGFRASWQKGLYGFPDLPDQSETIAAIRSYAKSVAGKFDTICVVGIGGSALGAWAIDCALRGMHPVQKEFSRKNPRLVILDNVDPSFVMGALKTMDPKRTLVVPIAKSGATAETVATLLIVTAWLESTLGRKARNHFAVVTSAGRGDLKQLAEQRKYPTFHLPENVGGRFSVLSAVGLLPAALTGADIRRLCSGASAMTKLCWLPDLRKNTALRAALCHHLLAARKSKSIQVAFPYSNRLWGSAFWFRQLWAESLGKRTDRNGTVVHAGQTPVAALGTTDQHSQVQLYMEGPNDKVFSFWAVRNQPDAGAIPKTPTGFEAMDYLCGQSLARLLDAERRSTEAALTENGRPNCTFTLDRVDEEHLGAFFQLMEFETAFAGEMLNINAFDQEGVELGKKFTFGLMGRKGFGDYKSRFTAYEAKRKTVKTV